MSDVLRYRAFVHVITLAVGECTVHRCSSVSGRWWELWAHVLRDADTPLGPKGSPLVFGVAIAPSGSAGMGPGGKTWSLTRVGAGRWQVSPSINVLVGPHSQWHRTPLIVGVGDVETWMTAP